MSLAMICFQAGKAQPKQAAVPKNKESPALTDLPNEENIPCDFHISWASWEFSGKRALQGQGLRKRTKGH